MYWCNGVVVAVNATMPRSVTLTSSQSQHANVILQCHCQLLSHCDILYTNLRKERIVRHTTSSISQNLCRLPSFKFF